MRQTSLIFSGLTWFASDILRWDLGMHELRKHRKVIMVNVGVVDLIQFN